MHSSGTVPHRIEALVTIINPAAADGSHYYTAWSKGCLYNGVAPYGQCALTTNPTLGLIYSDRTFPTNVPGVSTQVNQPFSMRAMDNQLVSLDISRNVIVSKSKTWNYELTYPQVTRSGNVVTGFGAGGQTIVLNLLKIESVVGVECTN